ncbi:hypothetical protein TNCV_39391 [Trichonephila clavipes]|nr:hypothetical protein TNCV_39391 [Trichonephila clavipes]
MALRNKESAMNKMSRCRTRNLAPVHSRRGRECDCESREKSLENRGRRLGRPRDFCDLPIRRDEGRVVNTPLGFKRGFFRRKGETEKERESRRRKKSRGERGAGLGWRKGLGPRLEFKDDERRWR